MVVTLLPSLRIVVSLVVILILLLIVVFSCILFSLLLEVVLFILVVVLKLFMEGRYMLGLCVVLVLELVASLGVLGLLRVVALVCSLVRLFPSDKWLDSDRWLLVARIFGVKLV